MTSRFLIRKITKLDFPLHLSSLSSGVKPIKTYNKKILQTFTETCINRSMFAGNISHFSIKNGLIKQLHWKIPQEEIFPDSKVEALHIMEHKEGTIV